MHPYASTFNKNLVNSMLTPSPAQLDLIDFVATYGQIYPAMPIIAKTVHKQHLTEADRRPAHLFKRFYGAVEALDVEQKLDILRYSKSLSLTENNATSSSPPASSTTTLSTNPKDYHQFQELNCTYRKKFHFPFLMNHKDLSVGQIIDQLQIRLENHPGDEFKIAFREVHRQAKQTLIAIYHAQQSSLTGPEIMHAVSTP